MFDFSKILCITNRNLSAGNFENRIESIAKNGPNGIILREKDLKDRDYYSLALKIKAICCKNRVEFIPHTFVDVAITLNCHNIHLPLPILRNTSSSKKKFFTHIGVSCHNIDEIEEAKFLGGTYVTLGHIFKTKCKENLSPKGLDFLQQTVSKASIPIYPIGGITPDNYKDVLRSGVKGFCIMSGLMECPNVNEYISQFKSQSIN